MKKLMYVYELCVVPKDEGKSGLRIVAYNIIDACMRAEAMDYEVKLVTSRREIDVSLVQRMGGNHE